MLIPFDQVLFGAATEHPYECRCEICLMWWENVPPEDCDEDNPDLDDEPAF